MDHVTTNAHSSGESQLYIFENIEAVIKMIIMGRSPTLRHVSRTHRVAFDWLFDRIILDSKIQIEYVDTKNHLADMLTKTSFTRDEWNHHHRLFNIMNFSMFSCNHLFLSNRKQRAMSKRAQEGISREGSAMAKPRPMNLVSHNLFSTRNKSPQNPGNAKAEQGGVSSGTWKQIRDTSQNPAVYSQVRQQEDTQNANTWIFRTHPASGNGCEVWRHVNRSKMEFDNMLGKVCQNLQKKWETTENSPQFWIEAIKTNALMW